MTLLSETRVPNLIPTTLLIQVGGVARKDNKR
jgi:hypothetical protein